ncbi:MAG: hypothetical protein ABFD83_06285 [Armatimonadota bacterium]
MTYDITDQLRSSCSDAAQKLYDHIINYVDEQGALRGPDSGVRWNLRVGRFVKSYLPFISWGDSERYFVQAQAYWIFSNVALQERTGDAKYLNTAHTCGEVLLNRQSPEGYWVYDDAGWSGRISSVDGCFGSLGLLRLFRMTKDPRYLDAAIRWYEYMTNRVGFQKLDEESASLRYFANYGRGMVPNNSTFCLWLLGELKGATGDDRFIEHSPKLLNFLGRCQTKSGEFPYSIKTEEGYGRDHYLCFQYHAFQFLDLARYYEITKCERVRAIMAKVTNFLSGGLIKNGDARFNCFKTRPMVPYYTAVVSAALLSASRLGIGDYSYLAERGLSRLISLQHRDGGFDYSTGNYLILKDRRSYPRMQAMILRHLLLCAFGEVAS